VTTYTDHDHVRDPDAEEYEGLRPPAGGEPAGGTT